MAKKKVDDVQPQAAVEEGSQVENREGQAQAKKSAGEINASSGSRGIVTTEGNTIDKVRISQEGGATVVMADYGKLQAGETAEERRANMKSIFRQLTPEQGKEYQRLYAEDPSKAKEYAVRQAFPMHLDDAAFHKRDGIINGRKVDYIVLEKLSEDKLKPEYKHLAGSWQIAFGEKGNKDSRFTGILSNEDFASIRHRAEVTLDEKGKVTSVGAPLSMADIAGRIENRVLSQRQEKVSSLESAQKVDWNKLLSSHKLPEGVALTGLRYYPVQDKPEQIRLTGKANGIQVSALLSKNETTAVKNKMLTLPQAAAVNKEFREKVAALAAPVAAVTMDAAVKAVVDRASSHTAKAFTPEQVKVLNDFAASAATPEDRQKLFDGVWAGAQDRLAGVNEAWVKDAHQELNDLSKGVVREEGQGLKR